MKTYFMLAALVCGASSQVFAADNCYYKIGPVMGRGNHAPVEGAKRATTDRKKCVKLLDSAASKLEFFSKCKDYNCKNKLDNSSIQLVYRNGMDIIDTYDCNTQKSTQSGVSK
jgi:hypothetical protein